MDKLFGFGYGTGSANAWIIGGSPARGFLGGVDHGPFESLFRGWAGAAWADWLFMLGLAGIAVALLFGVGLRIAAVSGTLMMLLMWAAEWPLDRHTSTGEPTRSTNPSSTTTSSTLWCSSRSRQCPPAPSGAWASGGANLDIVRHNRWLI